MVAVEEKAEELTLEEEESDTGFEVVTELLTELLDKCETKSAIFCASVALHLAGHVGIGLVYATPSHLGTPTRLSQLQKQYAAPGPCGTPSRITSGSLIAEPSEQAEAPAGGAHTAQAGRSSRSAARSAPWMLSPFAAPTSREQHRHASTWDHLASTPLYCQSESQRLKVCLPNGARQDLDFDHVHRCCLTGAAQQALSGSVFATESAVGGPVSRWPAMGQARRGD